MGGQNHQPTSSVLTAASAWLSQKIGEGFAHVLEANNHLENAIMLGMNKLYVEDVTASLEGTPSSHLRRALETLNHSASTLPLINEGFHRLLDAARAEGYMGNPLARRLKNLRLRPEFEGALLRPFVNGRIWQELEVQITENNVLDTLAWERSQFDQLRAPTADLIEAMRRCLRIAEERGARALVDAIENNQIPLRQYYAQVFSLWNYLHAMFLYSALIMTELFYRAKGFPSLLEFDPMVRGRNAA